VRQQFQHDHCLPETMVEILGTMSPEERVWAGKIADQKGSLLSKVKAPWEEANGYCVFDGMPHVINMLQG
jgi:hypothetical protein